MDAIGILKKDHANVKALFKEVEALGDRAKAARQKLFRQIDQELKLHTEIEEQIFYPRVKEAARRSSETRDLVLESYTEHAIVKNLLGELESAEPADESYKPKLKVLMELVLQHVQEEERELFPQVKKLMDAQELKSMGDEMLEMKEQAGAPA